MLNAIKKWINDERINELARKVQQQNALIAQQKKEIKDLQQECDSVRRGAKISQHSYATAYERGRRESTRMPWILWKDAEPYDHPKGGEKLLLLMPSGKTLKAYVASKYRSTGGDMFSGTYAWLETEWGERVTGMPVAWLPIELPAGFCPS